MKTTMTGTQRRAEKIIRANGMVLSDVGTPRRAAGCVGRSSPERERSAARSAPATAKTPDHASRSGEIHALRMGDHPRSGMN